MITSEPCQPPTDAEIDAAEERLNFPFHPDYRAFLKNCGNVGDALYEAAVVTPGAERRLDLFAKAKNVWELEGMSRDLLPFIEDNGDYFCLTRTGGVVFWSHNGATDEKWATFGEWYQQVCVEEPKAHR